MKFISEEILKYHNNREHGTTKLSKLKSQVKADKCDHCPQAFLHYQRLRMHNLEKHNVKMPDRKGKKMKVKLEKKERCDHCPQSFRHYNSLRKHSLVTHNIKIRWKKAISAYCKLCLKSFTEVGGYRSHVKAVHTSPEESAALQMDKIDSASLVFSCHSCEEMFLTGNVLNYHQRYAHSGTGTSSATSECRLCSTKFKNSRRYKEHINNIHKKFEEEMSSLRALEAGEEIASTSQCKFCQKKFLNQHVLKYHFDKVHKVEESQKVWSCDYCRKEIKPDRLMSSHIRNHMRDEHNLPEYSFFETSARARPTVNRALQNYQAMVARLQGGCSVYF